MRYRNLKRMASILNMTNEELAKEARLDVAEIETLFSDKSDSLRDTEDERNRTVATVVRGAIRSRYDFHVKSAADIVSQLMRNGTVGITMGQNFRKQGEFGPIWEFVAKTEIGFSGVTMKGSGESPLLAIWNAAHTMIYMGPNLMLMSPPPRNKPDAPETNKAA